MFPNFDYIFSPVEVQNTDWFDLVHVKKLRRAKMVPPTLLK